MSGLSARQCFFTDQFISETNTVNRVDHNPRTAVITDVGQYPGGVRTTIAKHHGRYSKSDHLCQDGME